MTTVTFKGSETKLSGNLPNLGEVAPPFELVAQDLSAPTLESFQGQKKLLNIFPSLDTSVCSKAMHTLFEKCKDIPNLILLNISMDLPFAAGRFCQTAKLEQAITLSTFRSPFPKDYGIQITSGPLQGLCARAVLLLSEENQVLHRELVPEITEEPNYNAVFEKLST